MRENARTRATIWKLAGWIAAACIANGAAVAASPPNVILIYADDLGAGLLGCYGQKIIRTPHIDRLAAEGMRFTNAHGCMYCAPARASLLTGLHDSHRGAWSITQGGLLIQQDQGKLGEEQVEKKLSSTIQAKPGEVFLAQVARRAGYHTAQFGKLDWGFTTTPERLKRHGWDDAFGFLDHVRAHGYYPPYLWRNGEKIPLTGNTHLDAGKTKESGYDSPEATRARRDRNGKAVYSQDVFIESLLQSIEEHRDERFFIYHPTQIPHGPVDVPEVHPDFADDDRLTDVQKEYASMVRMLDDHVGRIMAKLRELDLDRKTMVIFTSDNGHELYYVENKGRGRSRSYHGELDVFKGSMDLAGLKWTNWEGGIHVPLIVRWPGQVPAGSGSDLLTAGYDFMPTFAELMGIEIPDGKDGVSFLPTLLGREQAARDFIVVNHAVLAGRWKLVKEKNRFLLFDLRRDPGERNDVSKEHPDELLRLKKIFDAEVGSPRRDL
ncbi:MAG: arylsulfatase [Akkermansiaceae bacterium]|nr:arylsulfatase [Akkermansiaceae bacterium]MCP5543877.1 arylsulfatase [Akkermansiaceae bacterium]MCP5547509.1 arylsulfatase [Akkermansiaceae bacterium]